LSCAANMVILLILFDFILSSAQFGHIIMHILEAKALEHLL
jgi:hypothetical protein